MNARNMLKAAALPLVLSCLLGTAGCTQRTIIEEEVSQDEATDSTSETTTAGSHGALGNEALYVRSGDAKLGEAQSGPFPEPWQQRLGPFPEPWHRDGDDSDDGNSPPPPSDPNPNPDPNPKP
jgi:hypothetical protein